MRMGRLAVSPHSKKVLSSTSGWSLSVWSSPCLHGFPLDTPASSRTPQTCMGLGYEFKLDVDVSVRMNGWWPISSVGPAIDWHPVQGGPASCWYRPSPPWPPVGFAEENGCVDLPESTCNLMLFLIPDAVAQKMTLQKQTFTLCNIIFAALNLVELQLKGFSTASVRSLS